MCRLKATTTLAAVTVLGMGASTLPHAGAPTPRTTKIPAGAAVESVLTTALSTTSTTATSTSQLPLVEAMKERMVQADSLSDPVVAPDPLVEAIKERMVESEHTHEPKSEPEHTHESEPSRTLTTTHEHTPDPVQDTQAVPEPWASLAKCESHGEWDYGPHSGWGSGIYEGGLQFHPSTWDAYAPPGYPSAAYAASPQQQIAVAELVRAEQGWGAWPDCSRKLGLR